MKLSFHSRMASQVLGLVAMGAGMAGLSAQEKKSPAAGDEYAGVEIAKADHSTTEIVPVHVDTDEDRTIKPFHKQIFGYNFDWEDSGSILIDPKTGGVDPDAAELLKGVPFPLNRFAGADSQQFDWKGAIGPVAERSDQQLWKWVKPHPILAGPVEWWKWLQVQDAEASLNWVINLDEKGISTATDLAHFLTGEANNPWSEKRRELGIEKPIPVAIWELGNEMDWGNGRRWTVAQYIEACRKAIREIRAVAPGAKFAAHAASAPWNPNWQIPGVAWQEWHREVLKQLGPDLDYIVFHPYYQGYPTSRMEYHLDEIEKDILAITGSDRIKLYISEHARWPAAGRENWYQTHSLEGCVATAQFLLRCVNRPDVTAAAYHSFSAGPWGMIYRDKETGKLYTTALVDMFRMFGQIEGGSVVSSQVSGAFTDPRKEDLSFTVSTVRDADTLYLAISNLGPSRDASFQFRNSVAVIDGWRLTGPSPDAHNRMGVREVELKALDIRDKEFSRMVVPSMSLTLLKLKISPPHAAP